MGEKGNTEVIEQLKEMAKQQEPGLRDRVMQLLTDYQTITGLTEGDEDEAPRRPAGPVRRPRRLRRHRPRCTPACPAATASAVSRSLSRSPASSRSTACSSTASRSTSGG